MLIVFAFLVLITFGFTAVPGAVLGFGCVSVTQGLPRAARFALLLAVGAASAALWLLAVDGSSAPAIAGASFAGTLAAGFMALRRQARRLLAQQYESLPWPPQWPPTGTGR
ncbi:hypothetical protein ACWGVR_19685 [Streptomyces xanthophaeus]